MCIKALWIRYNEESKWHHTISKAGKFAVYAAFRLSVTTRTVVSFVILNYFYLSFMQVHTRFHFNYTYTWGQHHVCTVTKEKI